ncbi:hypothetical protein [Bacillus pumilus]|uniref:hypothetical protein n=1 Tax=Bacillus pumilus TaxID=1408 RepID=UPI001C24A002|nr:hypothetical protein [Bacillus pumilus]MBU8573700.1 hypothetical protein [Bacillus pumilus]
MTSVKTELNRLIEITEKVSPKVFINHNNELILVPTKNIYFRLEGVKTDLDLKCKVLAWLSRPSCKGVGHYWQKRVLQIFNEFLGTNFSKQEMDKVYTHLGNDVNRELSISFIESGYDLTV